jgi:hypothetical protein
LKVLHVGDHAGMASITANMCSKLGHPSVVLVNKEDAEPWTHGDHYENVAICENEDTLIDVVNGLDGKYEHIVYHNKPKLAIELDNLNITSSFVFHEDHLQQQPTLFNTINSLDSIVNIFVSTPDQLKYAPSAIEFVRPVDLDLFTLHETERIEVGLCLTSSKFVNDIHDIVEEYDAEVQIYDRYKWPTEYKDMPKILNSYSAYLDIIFNPGEPNYMRPELSTTALQALACGTPVWSNHKWFYHFPKQHEDEIASANFLNILMAGY